MTMPPCVIRADCWCYGSTAQLHVRFIKYNTNFQALWMMWSSALSWIVAPSCKARSDHTPHWLLLSL